jgi:hypothetical protein
MDYTFTEKEVETEKAGDEIRIVQNLYDTKSV